MGKQIDLEKKDAGLQRRQNRTEDPNKEIGSRTPEIIGQVMHPKLDAVLPDPNQPRSIFAPDKLAELSESIKAHGLIQPIVVRRNPEASNKYIIVAGERRYQAVCMAFEQAKEEGQEKDQEKYSKISAILTEGNPVELALIENIQREDLKPIEEAYAYQNLIDKHGYKQEQLGSIVNKPQPKISEILKLNLLPDEIKEDCKSTNISKNVLLGIVRHPEKEKIPSLYKRAKEGRLTVAMLAKMASKEKRGRKKSTPQELFFKETDSLEKKIKNFNKDKLDEETVKLMVERLNELARIINTYYSSS